MDNKPLFTKGCKYYFLNNNPEPDKMLKANNNDNFAGKVAGCLITEGSAQRSAKVRLLRDDSIVSFTSGLRRPEAAFFMSSTKSYIME